MIGFLSFLLGWALAVSVFMQVFGLPWLSGAYAEQYPDLAGMRWPLMTLAIIGFCCVETGVVCTLRLLRFTARDEVFSSRSLRWVDGIIGSFLAGSLVSFSTIAYLDNAPAGPPFWLFVLLFTAVGGIGLALLMLVMRSLLVQATTLRNEMETVI
ncbi:DUF2975 domain-containing protein [Spelaeicoccus albus]|uniref:DUF2975 family protein n=2 Tax=Spelaeicoccus albus TaxID=1280376 RepID=A0A7Z0IH81_9MICO|nr:hypothetical protein [Spelaeicoccus albus]